MEKVINCVIDYNTCIDYANKGMKEGNFDFAFHNLNEALMLAKTADEVAEGLKLFAESYKLSENVDNYHAVLSKLIFDEYDGAYTFFDYFDQIITDTDIFMDNEESVDDTLCIHRIRSQLLARQYELAFEKIMHHDFNESQILCLVEYLLESLDNDKNLHIGDYIISFISILARSNKRSRLIRAFFNDNELAKQVIVDSYDSILETTNEPLELIDIGEEYLLGNEIDIATKFLSKGLEIAPYVEKGLYYMAYVTNITEGFEKASTYLNKLRCYFFLTDFPYNAIVDFFRSEDKNFIFPYPELPPKFTNKATKQLIKELQNADLTESLMERINCYASVIGEENLLKVIDTAVAKNNTESDTVLNGILTNFRVSERVKRTVLLKLSFSDYDGVIKYADSNKVVCAKIAPLKHKEEGCWQRVYEKFVFDALISDDYYYLDVKLLNRLVKKASEKVTEFEVGDDNGALVWLEINYFRKLKVNMGANEIINTGIKSKEFHVFCEKYSLTEPLL